MLKKIISTKSRLSIFIILVLVLIFAGCKIDLKNEIWLNKDASGRALIQTYIEYMNFDDLLEDETIENTLTQSNVLQSYIDLIESTKGAKLISHKIIDQSDSLNYAATYQVEFKFDNINTLNAILSKTDASAFNYKKKSKTNTLKIFPPKMSIIDEGELKDAMSEYLEFDINYNMILHTPAKIKKSTAKEENRIDDKTVEWNFKIGEDWFSKPVESITVTY